MKETEEDDDNYREFKTFLENYYAGKIDEIIMETNSKFDDDYY